MQPYRPCDKPYLSVISSYRTTFVQQKIESLNILYFPNIVMDVHFQSAFTTEHFFLKTLESLKGTRRIPGAIFITALVSFWVLIKACKCPQVFYTAFEIDSYTELQKSLLFSFLQRCIKWRRRRLSQEIRSFLQPERTLLRPLRDKPNLTCLYTEKLFRRLLPGASRVEFMTHFQGMSAHGREQLSLDSHFSKDMKKYAEKIMSNEL